ncbi:hypothetical protein SAMN05660845_0324 [Flavobacterium swingsii]|uniref:Uncharacterized protein n=1 Tax=Flavobacterium swingsii TaxID=498292 RepID=A0A1I0VDV7_9FLAO|nr:hypothetical protein [Flavobacterium swingsii]SFA74217.1 hypothetical protein SAMN05660845_0324 [Flavobacterium swingsii]
MGKEDYLTRQINQLGFVLKKILEKLTRTKSSDGLSETVSVVNFKLNEQLGFDLEILDTISDDNLIEFLTQKEGFNHENLELFADILIKMDKEKYAKKALQIYNYVNQATATFSFERDFKIKELMFK